MEKKYKEVRLCGMCKKMFTVAETSSNFRSRQYCPECCRKYIKSTPNKKDNLQPGGKK